MAPALRDQPPRRRLSELVADSIQADIVASSPSPGDRLPTEAELATRFNVSRSVVREAARLLVQRGLVDVRPGRGMVARKFDGGVMADHMALMLDANLATFAQVMELRLVLELEISAKAAERREDHHLRDMLAAIDRAERHQQDRAVCLEADLALHQVVALASGNPFFPLVSKPINDFLRRAYSNAFGYLAHQPFTLREHRAIYDAIEARDVAGARQATQLHLERVMASSHELIGSGDGAGGASRVAAVKRPA